MSQADHDRIQAFVQQVANNPQDVLNHLDALQQQVDNVSTDTPTSSEPTPSPAPVMDPSTLAALVALFQSIPRQSPSVAVPSSSTTPIGFKSEKLPDIPEYDGNMEKLDPWEQSLVHKMHANHDRFPSDQNKIDYAESRLTVGSKAHNLMRPYRKDGHCFLVDFHDYRVKLRKCCGNPYEAQDARTYLTETLKQGTLAFDEYYNLFSQKVERSLMEDASLIDALQRNVSYNTQLAAMSWKTSEGKDPSTYSEWVQAYSETDNRLRQLKHRMPRVTTTNTVTTTPAKPKTPATLSQKSTPAVAVLPVAPVALPPGDPMDLSSAMATVKGQRLQTPRVKYICDKWKLCYYCKLQHPGKNAKECPNKGKSDLRLVEVEELDPEGGVRLPSGNV